MSKKPEVKPLGARILVSPKEAEERTKGGLIVPATAAEDQKPEVGVVEKLGTGVNERGEKINFSIKEGDTVFFKKYAPDEIEIEGEKYFIVDNADILAVL